MPVMSDERVSVVIPAWNSERTLARCLAAVAPQLRPGDEVLVVDDDSQDDTVALAYRVGECFPSETLRVIRLSSRRGPAAARNRGVLAAKAPYIWLLDSDAVPAPGWLATLLPYFLRDSRLVAAYGRYTHEHAQHCRWWQPIFVEAQARHEQRYQVDRLLPDPRGAIFRASAFQEIGGFDEGFDRPGREDIEFGIRLLRHYGPGSTFRDAAVRLDHILPASLTSVWRRYYHQGRGTVHALRLRGIPRTTIGRSLRHACIQLASPGHRGRRFAYYASTALARAGGIALASIPRRSSKSRL